MAEVGGLEGLKTWLREREKLFQMRESLSNDIVPKGLLMMGIPGCGKSLCVKAIASCFHLPLYRVDMIAIFSGRFGKPEGAFVEACRMMEDMAPAVLWFDEIEMGITSTDSGGEQGRIFAFFLTWMQEKTRGLFVAATANRIDLLPAEMIRKGRFDEVFFVDMPVAEEQIEIFTIHLNRRGLDAGRFQLRQLLQFTVGWTGAEIEQWKNAYWLCHRLLESKAEVYYGNIYDLPAELGRFDIALVGSVLEHLSDQITALASIAAICCTSSTHGRISLSSTRRARILRRRKRILPMRSSRWSAMRA